MGGGAPDATRVIYGAQNNRAKRYFSGKKAMPGKRLNDVCCVRCDKWFVKPPVQMAHQYVLAVSCENKRAEVAQCLQAD